MTVLRLDVELPFPVELVWQAMTDRHLLAEWFLQTDLAPVPGGVFRAFPTPGIPGFPAPFDVDVVEAVGPTRLALRWRGEQLHSDVVWELSTVAAGCRLRVSQTGFLGIAGEVRRAELQRAYGLMFEQRLPALLARLDAAQAAAPVKRRRSRDIYDAADMPRRPAAATLPAPLVTVSATTAAASAAPVTTSAAAASAAPASGFQATASRSTAGEVPAACRPDVDPAPGDAPGGAGLLRRLYGMPVDRRLRLLSVAGAMVLTVLAVTALTTLLLRTPGPSAGAPGAGRGPNSGVQAADPAGPASPTAAAASPAPSPAVSSPTSAPPSPSATAGEIGANTLPAVSAAYRTTESFTGGYIGEITIRPGPGGLSDWSATVDLPAGAQVTSAWDRIDFRQAGGRVVFTPQQVHRTLPAGRDFTFAFQVGDQSGATRPDGCAVNSTSCS